MTDNVSASKVGDSDLAEFAQAFGQLASEAYRLVQGSSDIADLAREHLGVDPAELPAIVEMVPAVERPNVQLAFEAMAATHPDSRLLGLTAEVSHYGGFSVATLLAGKFRGPADAVPPTYDELPIDVDDTLRCVAAGVWLLWHNDAPIVVGASPASNHGPRNDQQYRIEIFAAESSIAEGAAAELQRLRRELNVYREKVLSFSFTEYGEFGITFMARPNTGAYEVVLPPGDLESIERHTIGIAKHAEQLREQGQHLKRGLLLYGPPGTGKTHTISYLMAAMPERTVLLLQGPGIGALGQAAAIARSFPPAMVVIEDVDLIASERGMMGMHGSNPLMFQLLNEMDGLAPTSDTLFVLTTNRLEMLEPALAARPGRIDHAVHIDRPDRAAREQLLRLYLGSTADGLSDVNDVVERTEGVTASFFKELVRRATYLAIIDEGTETLNETHLDAALVELLDNAEPVMRALLGVDPGDEGPPSEYGVHVPH